MSGVAGVTHAFVPHPLPPVGWEWPAHLWPLLLDAHKALSALDGTGKHLRLPDLILRPLQRREAQKSSSLEGTYTDPREQALYALHPSLPDSATDPHNSFREVFNYTSALQVRRLEKDALPLSLRLIRRLHAVLMEGVRGSDKNPGEFRRLQNQVGRPARFVPPPATDLLDALSDFEKYLHERDTTDPLVRAFLAHYQFEAIHPFMDGNGRVGRLLLAITIAEGCDLSNEWLYMSDYFDKHKDAYIDRMLAVSTDGDWTSWIEFCLLGVVEQANDTLRRCERLIDLNRDFHERVNAVGSGSVRLSALIDELFSSPVIRATDAREKLNVSYPTARADLEKLEKLGIVTRLKRFGPITYGCFPIIDVTHSD
ncbi:MAG TPA: Fic family protein [Longimicrobium sp.]|nr:Fic family protein [Longimicrobium sp.]